MRFITALVSQEAKNLSGLYRGVAIHWSVSYWPLVLSPRAPTPEAIEEQLPSAGDRSAVLDDLERIEELNLLGDVRLEGAANVVARFPLTHWRQHLSNAGVRRPQAIAPHTGPRSCHASGHGAICATLSKLLKYIKEADEITEVLDDDAPSCSVHHRDHEYIIYEPENKDKSWENATYALISILNLSSPEALTDSTR
jgi:hypothetical protein